MANSADLRPKHSRIRIREVLVAVALLCCAVIFCSRYAMNFIPNWTINNCRSTITFFGDDLINNAKNNGHLPSPFVTGKDGRKWHSWRTLLAHSFHAEAINEYQFNEPWDGPHNSLIDISSERIYTCITDTEAIWSQTSYVAITGPDAAMRAAEPLRFVDIKGASRLVVVAETRNSGIRWTAPIDIDVEEAVKGFNREKSLSIGSNHRGDGAGGGNALFGDGHVEWLSESIDPAVLRQLLQVDRRQVRKGEE